MLYNGAFGCHGNTCYVIFIGAIFYMFYSICPINVCTDFEINRYKIDEVRPLTYFLLFVTRTAHDVLEYPCEVSLECVQ